MRVELLTTVDCPHAERAEEIARSALADNGHSPVIEHVYVGDIDDAAGLGFHGSPTLRIDGIDVVRPPADLPINLGCRLYPQADGHLDGVIPAETITAEVARRREAEAHQKAARSHPRQLPAKISRAFFLWAAHRRSLGRIATAIPITRRMVRRFVAGDSLADALTVLEGLREQGMRWAVMLALLVVVLRYLPLTADLPIFSVPENLAYDLAFDHARPAPPPLPLPTC